MDSTAERMGWKSAASVCGLVLFVTSLATAEDLTTSDGRTYKDVTVTKVEPDAISITHETGSAKLPFAKLPEAIQRKHGYDAAKAEAFVKEQSRRRAELDAFLKASREKEAVLQKSKLPEAFTVTPESAEDISVQVQSRVQFQQEQVARWRMELYREDEIQKMLAEPGPVAKLLVRWRRSDYDAAATEHFRVIVSDTSGTVRFRTGLEYRSPKQTGEGVYSNGDLLSLEEVQDEFRVRVVDSNEKVFADFVVRRAK